MKKIILFAAAIVLLTAFSSCSVNSSKIDVDSFETEDIIYFKDLRTGLCFGVAASRVYGATSSTGMGMTCVPCESLKNVKVYEK